MRDSLWYKRIPTLLGLLLLGIGMVSLNYAIHNSVFFLTRATPPYAPEEIRITNVTDTSFSVSYVTKEAVVGSLSYGINSTGDKFALDDRDQQSGNPMPYFMHHITVKNLKPNTTYYFTINSKDKSFLNNDQPFTVKTLPTLKDNPTKQPPIVGSVFHQDGTKSNDVIVFLVTENAQTLSVLTKQDGSFIIPLNALRTKDYTSYFTFTDSSVIKLLARGKEAVTTASVLATQINPVPPLTLGNSYDFTSLSQLSPVPISSHAADITSFPSFSATEASPHQLTIINPSQKEAFTDAQPQFEGTAIPNSQIEIEINSETHIKTTIRANKNGNWVFRPSTKLTPGEHTITIRARDAHGILQTLTRSFTVYAEGSQFTEPSVSPSPPSPTPQQETDQPVVETPTPTLEETPTPTLTSTPTPTPPVVTGILTQSVPPPQEPPGSSLVLITGIIAAITLSTGVFLLFLGKNTL